MKQPLTKVEIIERSISCFELGLWGLLPVIGLPLAVRSLFQFFRAQGTQPRSPNPADRLRRWGIFFAAMGVAEFVAIFCAVASYFISIRP